MLVLFRNRRYATIYIIREHFGIPDSKIKDMEDVMMRGLGKFTGKVAATLVLSLCIGSAGINGVSSAGAKPSLNTAKKTLKVGASCVIKVKNVKKVTWSTANRKIVKLAKVKKKSVKAIGLKPGKTSVFAKFKAGGKNKKLKCAITVKKNDTVSTKTPAASAAASAAAVVTASPEATTQPQTVSTHTPVPTDTPSPTPVPTTVPTPSVMSDTGAWAYIPVDDDSLLKEYEGIFGKIGRAHV